ncbi:ribonuclease H-like domain-containing protein [Tanacetum coccineum]
MVSASSCDDKIINLDLGNPLHLQTSDFNSNNIISIKLTGTENYRVWAAAMKLAINTRNKIGFLDGTCLKSTYANKLFLGQFFSDNASEVWAELKETYDKLDGEDISKHNQLIKLMQFLMGHNDVFQPIRRSLIAREILPDVKDAFAIISREESHRGIAYYSSHSVTKPQVSCFMDESNSWNNSRNKKFNNNKRVGNFTNNRGPNPNLYCTNCGKVGYTVERCSDIIGYPSRYNKNSGPKPNGLRTFNANSVSSSSKKGASLSFTNQQMMKLMNLINEAPSGNVQANMAGFASKQNCGDWLGHPSDQAIYMLQQDLNFTKDSDVSPCDICHKAKQTREPFPFSDHQTTKIGELIHLDL